MPVIRQLPLLALLLLTVACNGTDPAAGNGNDDIDHPGDPAPTHDYIVNELVTGLQNPWGMAFLPSGDILITERPGRVRLVRDGQLQDAPAEGGPSVAATGQGGLLDIALHPDFGANGLVYMTYSKAVSGGITTAVARAQWADDQLNDLEDVFVADAVAGGGQHFGSRLVFDGDQLMYVTVGDRGMQDPAQDLTNHIGTTLRLNDDGGVPGDNPFTGDADARDEIYTYGNRNAQGMTLHPETGEIWQNEHGPRGGDELNRMVAGANYGWPQVSFGNHYNGTPIPDPEPGDNTEHPVLHWTPALAPSGLAFYTGDRFPHWQGNAFNGGLAGQRIVRVVLDGDQAIDQEDLIADRGWRIRAVVDGPDGYLYFLTDSANGMLARLEPVN